MATYRIRTFAEHTALLREHPWHPTQTEVCTCPEYSEFTLSEEDDGFMDVLTRKVLAAGTGVMAVEPEPFRRHVIEELERMAGMY